MTQRHPSLWSSAPAAHYSGAVSDTQVLAVIIVSYNSNDVLPECLTALDTAVLNASAVARPVDVVVVDNASRQRPHLEDGVAIRVRVVDMGRNAGFAPAVNWGLNCLSKEVSHVLLLNPDARLTEDALAELLRVARTRRAALVGPLLVGEGGSVNGYSERPFHSVRLEVMRQFLGRGPKAPASRRALHGGQARCLTGACLLVDAPFLRANGGLDDALPMYLEDVELCAAAHRLGRPVVLAGTARCVHALGGSSGGDNFSTNSTLHLMLLAARVEFVRRRSRMRGAAMRSVIAFGALMRLAIVMAKIKNGSLPKHRQVLAWALRSGRQPAWPPAFVDEMGRPDA